MSPLTLGYGKKETCHKCKRLIKLITNQMLLDNDKILISNSFTSSIHIDFIPNIYVII